MQRKISAAVLTAVLLVFAVFPAFAAEFTPSATAKPAPAVVPVNNASGDEVDAIIFDSEGNEKHSVPKGSLKLIPYSDRSSADDAVKAELESVYSSLQSADISKLNSGVEARLKQAPKTVKAENLVVRDLFNIGVDSASQTALSGGSKMRILLDAKCKQGDFLLIMVKNGEKWELLPAGDVKLNADGTLSADFSRLGTVIIITDRTAASGPKSPKTSDPTAGIIAAAALLCGSAALLCGLRRKKA